MILGRRGGGGGWDAGFSLDNNASTGPHLTSLKHFTTLYDSRGQPALQWEKPRDVSLHSQSPPPALSHYPPTTSHQQLLPDYLPSGFLTSNPTCLPWWCCRVISPGWWPARWPAAPAPARRPNCAASWRPGCVTWWRCRTRTPRRRPAPLRCPASRGRLSPSPSSRHPARKPWTNELMNTEPYKSAFL